MTLQATQAQLVEAPMGAGETTTLTLESGPSDEPNVTVQQEQAPQNENNESAHSQSAEDLLKGDDIPEQYRNKSARELLDVIRNKDEIYGRQSNELGQLRDQVGTLRGIVDSAIAMQAGEQPSRTESEEAELTADALLNAPGESIGRSVEKAIKPISERLDKLDYQDRLEAFTRDHPTAINDVNDDKFVEFVGKSAYRQRLAAKAFADTSKIDFEAAEELWLAYEEANAHAPAPEAEAEPVTKPAKQSKTSVEDVSMVAAGGSGATPSSDKTVYSADALVKLQMTDPDRYYEPNFYKKIAQAYAEGRVK